MSILATIFYFLITIGILVLVHELGHFLAAKLTGMRVDRFSIGFPPRAFGKKIGDTDYCISWIPIGGYVKIAGMIDESMDTEFINKPPEPWEFRSKPFLAKFFVMIAGVLMNVLLAVVIFWGINLAQGKFLKETNTVGYVTENSIASKIGIRTGDKIITVGNKTITHWDEISTQIFLEKVGNDIEIKIQRNGEPLSLIIPYKEIKTFSEEDLGIFPEGTATLITAVEPGKPAENLGLKPGDIFITINNQIVNNSSQVKTIIEANAGKELYITWKRNEDTLKGAVLVTTEGRIGVGLGTIYIGPKKQVSYSVFEALNAGINNIIGATKLFAYSIKQIIIGKAKFSQSFGGPIKIAQMATQSAEMGWISFLAFMGLLSISLAIINIIPFPALDGGHILFLFIELIIRRELPVKIKMAIQQVGFFMLLALMAYVIYNDIVNF
ncbi:MAG: Membrane-associated zinc metalloprotease [Ignavibacteriae bacterium]|nr:MAG: Membrane-associated zinc metalloprotease [Ignavibacteriota bacterium]